MISVVEFDFERKVEGAVGEEALRPEAEGGCYWWVDLAPENDEETKRVLRRLGVNDNAVEGVVGPDVDGRYDVYDDCLHFSLAEAVVREGRLQTSPLDVLAGPHFLVTVHRKPVELLQHMRRTYREDFRKFARSPGFLLYELGDHLLDGYRRSLREFSGMVEAVQLDLFGAVDDAIFRRVSGLTTDLLGFRAVVRAARELLHQLASRRSPFVSETTQPFLEVMAGAMQRLSDDLHTEREVLNETLNLYMGMVSHRTNAVVNRLTTLSVIFLPLSFLCGVYGMNLTIPETQWPHAYALFWGVVVLLTGGLLWMMRRRKWI